MASAPQSLFNPYSRPAVVWGVFLGDADGNRPELTDRVDWLKIAGIQLRIGDRPDSIQLEVLTANAGIRIQDLVVPVGYSRLVEVRQLDDKGQWTRCIAWGQLATQGQRLADKTETLTVTVRLDWFLFGGRLSRYQAYDDRGSGTILDVERDIVFNPVIDGQTEANRSDAVDEQLAYLVVSADSMRTQEAIALQGQAREFWDLPTAIHTLCSLMNSDEEFITCPNLADLQAVITDTNERLLKNVRIPLGTTLPHALDLVCEPCGYRWFVESIVDTTDPGLPISECVLRFFKRGVGIVTDLKCQRVGDVKKSDQTNISDYSATLEIATANVVVGRGSLKQREGTFVLVPGWKSTLDTTDLGWINWNKVFTTGNENEIRPVGRLWVLNEAGDHGGKRAGIDSFTDLADLFEEDVTRIVRRRLLPCLTKTRTDADRAQRGSGGLMLEWHDGTGWQPYKGSFSVLDHECGVFLDGEIDEAFWAKFQERAAAVDGATELADHLRVTACIEADARLTYTAERRDVSPNGREIELALDVADRFHDRLVRRSGTFASRWTDNHFAVTNVDTSGTPWFLVGSDITARIKAGDSFIVRGSTGNDGRYTAESVNLAAGSTRIFTKEVIRDDTVDGLVAIDTEEAADLPALTRFSDEARDVHDGATVAVSASLKGHDWHEYKRGNIVEAVQPRNLSLNNYHDSQPQSRHPQIVGINYLFGQNTQRTELVLEVPEAERRELEPMR